MTMPHLMNCSHSGEGWCIKCVSLEHDLNEDRVNHLLTVIKMKDAEINRLNPPSHPADGG